MGTSPDAIEPIWVSINDAAELLGISHFTVRRMIQRGTLKAYRPAGTSAIRIRRRDLERAMKPIPAAHSGNLDGVA